MTIQVDLQSVVAPSENVVARIIEGEVLIVPLAAASAIPRTNCTLLTRVARLFGEELDGQRSLKDVVRSLADKFDAPLSDFENDVLGFATELARRGILVAKT